jgi:hypothetical protein
MSQKVDLTKLWEQAEEDGSFDSVFVKVSKGDQIAFMLAPVIQHEEKPVLYKKVDSIFRKDGEETKTQQYLVRIIPVKIVKKEVDFDEVEVKCLQASRTMFNSLVKLVNNGYELGGETGHVLVLSHDGKRNITPTPKQATFPKNVLEMNQEQLSWTDILEEHEKLQDLSKEYAEKEKPAEAVESMPWEE